jgi:hypothetical protein
MKEYWDREEHRYTEEDLESMPWGDLDILFSRVTIDILDSEEELYSRPKEGQPDCWTVDHLHNVKDGIADMKNFLERVILYKKIAKMDELYALEQAVGMMDDATQDDIWSKADDIMSKAIKR